MIAEQQQDRQFSQQDVELAIKEAVTRREEELRILVMKRETEVAQAMARREEEIMEAVKKREAEIFEEWKARETSMQQEIEKKIKDVEERVDWIQAKEDELNAEDARLETVRLDLEAKIAKWEESAAKGQTRFTLRIFCSSHLWPQVEKKKPLLKRLKIFSNLLHVSLIIHPPNAGNSQCLHQNRRQARTRSHLLPLLSLDLRKVTACLLL